MSAHDPDEVSTGGERVVCAICGLVLSVPGFDHAQAARALAQHVQANHGREVGPAGTGKSTDTPAADDAVTSSAGDPGATNRSVPVPQVSPPIPTDAGATRDHQGGATRDHPGGATDDGPDGAAPEGPTSPPSKPTPSPRPPDRDPRAVAGTGPPPPSDTSPPRPGDELPPVRGGGPATPTTGTNTTAASTAGEGDPATTSRAPDAPGAKRDDPARPAEKKPLTPQQKLAKGETPSAREVAREAVTKGVQTAAASVGVPPMVTKVLIKVAPKAIAALLAFALIMLAALFGGVLTEDAPEDTVWDVPLSEQLDIPAPYLDAYQNAARANKLPWTLLAAVGAQASYHGRIDPYKQPIPSPATASRPGGLEEVVLLGDSLSVGTDTYLRPLLASRGASYTAKVESGQRTGWGVEYLKENPPATNATLVVGFGTNDSAGREAFARDVDALMNTLRLTNRVWWLTVDKPDGEIYNQVLREKARRWPNLQVAEWTSYAQTRGVTRDATLHYNGEGYRVRAEFTLATITGSFVTAGLPTGSDLTGPGVLPAPEGTCPMLPSPIQGASGAQGAGPLMLLPNVLASAGRDLGERLQNICTSADTLAEILADTAVIVAEEAGQSFPRGIAILARDAGNGDGEAAEFVHRFWAEVVDRAGVLGTVEETVCTVGEQGSQDDQSYVGAAIDAYWRCALSNTALSSVGTVNVGADGVVSYQLLGAPEAVRRGVDEALSVAWTWSRWGEADCDEDGLYAGVFPLEKRVFTNFAAEYAGDGRCDVEANIVAAARAFAAGESTPAGARSGFWNASIGGWARFPAVTGPPGPTIFDLEGPWSRLSTGTACNQLLVNGLVAAAGGTGIFAGESAGAVQGYIANGLSAVAAVAADELLAGVVRAAQADPLCASRRTHLDTEWYGALAGAFNGDALTGVDAGGTRPRLTVGNLDVPAGVGDVAAALAARAYTRSVNGVPTAIVGSTALLQRLWNVQLAVPVRPALSRERDEDTLSLGSQIVNLAVAYYGGLFVGADGQSVAGFGFLDSSIPYHEEFNAVGQEYGIDPRLLAALARQESNFNPDAGCPNDGGGVGMMQKDPDMTPTLCGDVRRQVRLAAEMLLGLYERAGDWRGAIWGYNNGGGFASKWRELNGDIGAAAAFAREYYCSRPEWSGTRSNGQQRQRNCEWRAEVAMKYVSDDPADRSAWVTWLEYQRVFPSTVIGTTQLVVNGNECPNVPPLSQIAGRSVLRGGAEAIGVRQLCVESVAQAPTAEAARAIIFAFKNLGVPYSQPLRNQNAFDCSSYVSRAYQSTGIVMSGEGNYFSTHSLFSHSGYQRPEWVVPVPAHSARPGDLVFPSQGHVAMIIARGYIIHTNNTGDVSKVEPGYSSPLQVNRVLPQLAPRLTGP